MGRARRNTCRLCMKPVNRGDTTTINNLPKTFAHILEEISGLKFTEADGLHMSVCIRCRDFLQAMEHHSQYPRSNKISGAGKKKVRRLMDKGFSAAEAIEKVIAEKRARDLLAGTDLPTQVAPVTPQLPQGIIQESIDNNRRMSGSQRKKVQILMAGGMDHFEARQLVLAASAATANQGVVGRGTVQTQRGVVQRGAVQRSVQQGAVQRGVQQGAVQRGVVQRGTVQRGVVQRGAVQRGVVQRGVVQGGVVQRGAVQRGVVQRGAVQRGVQRGTVQRGAVQRGVVQRAVVQRDGVQRRVVQRGTAQAGLQRGSIQRAPGQRGSEQNVQGRKNTVPKAAGQRAPPTKPASQNGTAQNSAPQRAAAKKVAPQNAAKGTAQNAPTQKNPATQKTSAAATNQPNRQTNPNGGRTLNSDKRLGAYVAPQRNERPAPYNNRNNNRQQNDNFNQQTSSLEVGIVPFNYPNVQLDDMKLEALKEAITNEIFKIPQGGPLIRFLGTSSQNGWLKLICADELSYNWLSMLVARWERAGVRMVEGNSLPQPPIVLSLYLPGDFRSADEILYILERQNNSLSTNQWRILNSETDSNGQSITISVDEQSFQSLQNRDFMVFLGLGVVEFKPQRFPSNGGSFNNASMQNANVQNNSNVSNSGGGNNNNSQGYSNNGNGGGGMARRSNNSGGGGSYQRQNMNQGQGYQRAGYQSQRSW